MHTSYADPDPAAQQSLLVDDCDPPSDNFPVIAEHDAAESLPSDANPAELWEELLQMKRKEEARRLLESAGIVADHVKVRALAALDTAEERQALLETWPAAHARKPRSSSPAGGFVRPQQLPSDPKTFATLIR